MESDLVDPIVVEVTDEGFVAGVAKEVGTFSCTQDAAIGSKPIDQVDLSLAGSVDGNGVTTVAVEVAGQGDVARVAEEEPDVGDAL